MDGTRGLVLECPKTHNRPGYDAGGGGRCARRVLGAERDFQDKRGRLQEEVDALSHHVLFYPKFLPLSAIGVKPTGLQGKGKLWV